MARDRHHFRHESLQDRKSIQDILKAITKGIGKGALSLSDDEAEIQLEPNGLLQLKVSAREEDERQRLDIKITWSANEKVIEEKPLVVSPGESK